MIELFELQPDRALPRTQDSESMVVCSSIDALGTPVREVRLTRIKLHICVNTFSDKN